VAEQGDLARIFGGVGGGDGAAPEGGPSGDGADPELDELAGDDTEADAPPPDFAVHAAEAFPELAGDDARMDALYRTIKACHPVA
jgi:hypothetical protein